MTPEDVKGSNGGDHPLHARRAGVHAQQEALVFMRTDCPVCRSEGLTARSQVLVRSGQHEVIGTLYPVSTDYIGLHEVGLSEAAWERLQVSEGDPVVVRHAESVNSLSKVRHRIYGHRLDREAMQEIMSDIVAGRYSDVHLAAFITACATVPLDERETIDLTRVMIGVGDKLSWANELVVDKHCVGGLPGNRTTPIVVAIVAAHGLLMPKTSSRAITSPAGTADTMETMAPVDLDLAAIRRVVEQESGCIVWGGSVRLSPADDILIRIERALELDAEGQLIASVLSKKIAAGSTHIVLDLPVGPTAKLRGQEAANALATRLVETAATFGVQAKVVITDGTQPVGRGIGPALEAHDVLAVLQRQDTAPMDLHDRACALAGALLEIGGRARPGDGFQLAAQTVKDNRAWRKFQAICEAQGGFREPGAARLQRPILADKKGEIAEIDNRKIAKLAKLAGAPETKVAGVKMHVRAGDKVIPGQPLCTVHADTEGELRYALDYAVTYDKLFRISEL